jgi:mannosyltransferase
MSPSWLIASLRGIPPAALQEKLWLGSRLFKVGLVILGLYIIILGRLPIWKPVRKAETSLAGPKSKTAALVLGIILALSLGLSLYRLNAGLWIDEIITFVRYAKMPYGEILTTYDSQNLHPLFALSAHASYSIFGSAWSLRLPAVLFGVAGLAALCFFALRVGGRLEALLSVALLAFSYQYIWFSQNARGYTGLFLWTILSSWLLLKGIRENRPAIWISYAAIAALGVYTHFTMGFVILGQLVVYFIEFFIRPGEKRRLRWTGLFSGFGLAALFIFQLHALILPQILGRASREGTSSMVTAWKNPLWTVVELFNGLKNAFSGNLFAMALAVLIFGIGIYDFVRKKPALVLLFSLPPLIAFFVLKLLGHPLFPRTFFFLIGFLVMIMIRGAMLLGQWSQSRIRPSAVHSNLLGGALCLGLVFVSALSVPRVYGPKQDYQGALAFIEEKERPGDQVVVVGFNATFAFQKFLQVNWPEVRTLDDLNDIRSRSTRTWLVYTISRHIESEYPGIYESLQRDFTLIKAFPGTLEDGEIYAWRSDKPRPA